MKKVEASSAMESDEETKQEDIILQKVRELELSLPRKNWIATPYLYLYQNFWVPSFFLNGVVCFQANFRARDSDILLASKPKSGTTWLQALAYAILNRGIYPVTNNQDPSRPHPLLSYSPKQLAPLMEIAMNPTMSPNLPSNPHPQRLFATHVPYNALPDSIKTSGCRIVYICRNILDAVVSYWFFSHHIKSALLEGSIDGPKGDDQDQPSSLEDYVDSVCSGVEDFGPHWDHVLGYWQESIKRPSKVLFMKYEDIKTDEILEMKRLAEFMGCPFTINEEETGVIQRIAQLCSFKTLKDVNIVGNKSHGSGNSGFPKFSAFFRNGEVGDWMNHLNPSMVDRLENVMEEKFHGSGLTFKPITSNETS